LPLLVVEVAAQQQLQLDAVDLALARVALEARLDAVERPALAFGVQGKSGCDPLQRPDALQRNRAFSARWTWAGL